MENQLPFLHKSLGSSLSFPHEDLSTSSSNVNSTGSESQGYPSESKDENDVPFGQPCCFSRYKLFGVNLIDTQPELPSPQFAVFSKISSFLSIPPMSQSSISATIPATKPYQSIAVVTSEKTCKKCRSVIVGVAQRCLSRELPLEEHLTSHVFLDMMKLISELDWMFDFGRSLINGSSVWHVTCVDDDGDMTLLGDYPWHDFQSMVQKMIICPKDGVNNLNPSNSADPTSLYSLSYLSSPPLRTPVQIHTACRTNASISVSLYATDGYGINAVLCRF